jgi:hypothetical protein
MEKKNEVRDTYDLTFGLKCCDFNFFFILRTGNKKELKLHVFQFKVNLYFGNVFFPFNKVGVVVQFENFMPILYVVLNS